MTFLKAVVPFALAFGIICLSSSVTGAQRVRVIRSEPARVETPRRDKFDARDSEFAIHDLVNAERRRRGIGELDWNDDLARVAREYSKKMARENFFSHTDRDGNSVVERVSGAGLGRWSRVGENLFYSEGYDSFERLSVRGWMESPGHRRNLLDGRYTAAGIGVARGRDGRVYVTQVFIGR